MGVQKFEDLIAWQNAQDLSVSIYTKSNNLSDSGFKDQIRRASVSISNSIAEGFDRSLNADFSRFLYISLGSTSEVKSILYLAERLGYIDSNVKSIMFSQAEEVAKILRGLIKSLKT